MSFQRLAIILTLGTLILHPALAAKSTAPGVTIEDSARRAIQGMSDYLRAAKSFSFKADVQYDDILPSGQTITFSAHNSISLQRPNAIFSDHTSDTGNRKFWYNGREICLLDPLNGSYATEAFSGNSDKALEHMIQVLKFTPPLADFIYENPAKALLGHTIQGFVVGKSLINGTPTTHLAFVDEFIDWQIWIEDGKLPVPVRFAITYKTVKNSPQYVATFSEWDFSSRLPESLFQPEIPPGAVKLPFLKQSGSFKAEGQKSLTNRK
ncbi:MAG: hypothetical protein RLZ25_368 [Pseudomonadota bacterium]|jgi:hypothetical protein